MDCKDVRVKRPGALSISARGVLHKSVSDDYFPQSPAPAA
jgi:hypothetical protein